MILSIDVAWVWGGYQCIMVMPYGNALCDTMKETWLMALCVSILKISMDFINYFLKSWNAVGYVFGFGLKFIYNVKCVGFCMISK